MNLFELSHSDWDEYSHYLFTHNNKTQEDFKNDCESIIRDKFDIFMKEHIVKRYSSGFIGMPALVSFIAEHLPELGYEKAVKNFYSLNGTGIIEQHDSEYETIKDIIGEEKAQAITSHNKKVYKR